MHALSGYRLYGAPGAGSGIVEAALAVLAIPCELRDLDARNGEHRGEAFAAINPSRKMPALQTPRGEVLTESVAIVLTLDERHPGTLLPALGSAERAQAMRWLVYVVAELYPLVEIMDYPERFSSPSNCSEVKASASGLWHQRWQVLEGAVSGEGSFLTAGFSAIDLFITLLSRWDMAPEWMAEHLPRVLAIGAAVRSRADLATVWARHIPG